MNEEKIQRLAKLFEITNNELTREEFLQSFKKVMDQMLRMREELLNSIKYKESIEQSKLNQLQNQLAKKLEQKAGQELSQALILLSRQGIKYAEQLINE